MSETVNINFTSNTKELAGDIKAINTDFKEMSGDITTVKEAIEQMPGLTKLTESIELSDKAMLGASEKAESLKSAINGIDGASITTAASDFEKMGEAVRLIDVGNLNAELKSMKASVNEAFSELKAAPTLENLENALSVTNEDIERCKASAVEFREQLNMMKDAGVEQTSKEFMDMQTALSKTLDTQVALEKQATKISDAYEKANSTVNELSTSTSKAEESGSLLAKMAQSLPGDFTEAAASAQKIGTALTEAKEKAGSFGESIKSAFSTMTGMIGFTALQDAWTDIANSAKTLFKDIGEDINAEVGMTKELQRNWGLTADQAKATAQQIVQMSTDTGVGVDNVKKIAEMFLESTHNIQQSQTETLGLIGMFKSAGVSSEAIGENLGQIPKMLEDSDGDLATFAIRLEKTFGPSASEIFKQFAVTAAHEIGIAGDSFDEVAENAKKMNKTVDLANQTFTDLGNNQGIQQQADKVTSLHDAWEKAIATVADYIAKNEDVQKAAADLKTVFNDIGNLDFTKAWADLKTAIKDVEPEVDELLKKLGFKITLTDIINAFEDLGKKIVEVTTFVANLVTALGGGSLAKGIEDIVVAIMAFKGISFLGNTIGLINNLKDGLSGLVSLAGGLLGFGKNVETMATETTVAMGEMDVAAEEGAVGIGILETAIEGLSAIGANPEAIIGLAAITAGAMGLGWALGQAAPIVSAFVPVITALINALASIITTAITELPAIITALAAAFTSLAQVPATSIVAFAASLTVLAVAIAGMSIVVGLFGGIDSITNFIQTLVTAIYIIPDDFQDRCQMLATGMQIVADTNTNASIIGSIGALIKDFSILVLVDGVNSVGDDFIEKSTELAYGMQLVADTNTNASIIGSIGALIKDFSIQVLVDGVNAVGDDFADKATQVAYAMDIVASTRDDANIIGEIGNILKDFSIQILVDAINNVPDDFQNKATIFADGSEYLADHMPKEKQGILQTLGGIAQGWEIGSIANGVSAVPADFQTKATIFGDGSRYLADHMPKDSQDILQALGGIAEGWEIGSIAKGVSAVPDDFNTKATNFGDGSRYLADHMPKDSQSILQALGGIAEGWEIGAIAKGVSNVPDNFKDKATMFADGARYMSDHLPKQHIDLVATIGTALQNFNISSIINEVKSIPDNFYDKCVQFANGCAELAQGVKNMNSAGGASAVKSAASAAQSANVKSSNPLADIDDSVTSISSAVMDGISSGVSMLGSAVSSINSSTFAKAGQQADTMTTGQYIANQTIDNDYSVNNNGDINIYQQPGEDADTLVDKIQDALGSKYWNGRFAQ